MAHLNPKEHHEIAQEPEWLPVAAQVGQLANRLSGRWNLVAKVAVGAGRGAPACFVPKVAEIEIDPAVLMPGAKPHEIDLVSDEGMLRRAALTGAIMHEASHAVHSLWITEESLKDVPRRILDVITTLEEGRIEHQLVQSHGAAVQPFLRATALEIVAKDFRVADTRYGASIGAALTLARVTGGVLSTDDVVSIRPLVVSALHGEDGTGGEETLDALEAIWTDFQKIQTRRRDVGEAISDMIDCAKRWLAALGIDATDPTDDLASKIMEMIMGGDSDDGHNGGDSDGESGALSDMIKEIAVEVGSAAESGAIKDRKELIDRRLHKSKKDDLKREAEHVEVAKAVFGEHADGGSGRGGGVTRRPPSDEERRAVVALSRKLERISYADRAVSKVTSVAPPGRLRARQAVMREVERSRGAIMRAEPWQAKRRVHTDQVPLTVGLMTDVSGSMGHATEPMGALSWILPEATRRIDGRVAAVTFGSSVRGILKPGQRQDEVVTVEALDGFEAFKEGFSALDGALGLLNAQGARLLVLASDGEIVHDPDANYADKMMKVCRDKGIAVLWLNFGGGVNTHGYGTPVQVPDMSALEVAETVGQAAIDLLSVLSKERQQR